jgi:hypothetical protein
LLQPTRAGGIGGRRCDHAYVVVDTKDSDDDGKPDLIILGNPWEVAKTILGADFHLEVPLGDLKVVLESLSFA